MILNKKMLLIFIFLILLLIPIIFFLYHDPYIEVSTIYEKKALTSMTNVCRQNHIKFKVVPSQQFFVLFIKNTDYENYKLILTNNFLINKSLFEKIKMNIQLFYSSFNEQNLLYDFENRQIKVIFPEKVFENNQNDIMKSINFIKSNCKWDVKIVISQDDDFRR